MINLDLALSSWPVVIQKILFKDTQHWIQLTSRILPTKTAAQPCSYIYPIYSVVKNRLRAIQLQRYGPRARL